MKLGNIVRRSRKDGVPETPGPELYGSLIATLGALGTGIVAWDGGAESVVWANKAAHDLLGARIDEVPDHVQKLLPVQGQPYAGIEVISDESAHYDRSLVLEDGSMRVLEVAARPWFQSMTILSFRDVTERRKLEGFRDRFVASAAHELRTPLTPVIGLIKVLQKSWRRMDEATIDESLAILDRGCGRLLTLVTNLLDLSRLESGRFDLDLTSVQLQPLIEDVVASLTTGKDIYIDVDDITVLANTFAIRISAEKVFPSSARVTVSDDGPGVAPEVEARLFEAFARGPASDGGTGLGLTIAQTFARACGGTLSYQHTDAGTSFIATLPLGADA
jgi:signal transduction histidine kinase